MLNRRSKLRFFLTQSASAYLRGQAALRLSRHRRDKPNDRPFAQTGAAALRFALKVLWLTPGAGVKPFCIAPISALPPDARQDASGVWHFREGQAVPLADDEMDEVEPTGSRSSAAAVAGPLGSLPGCEWHNQAAAGIVPPEPAGKLWRDRIWYEIERQDDQRRLDEQSYRDDW